MRINIGDRVLLKNGERYTVLAKDRGYNYSWFTGIREGRFELDFELADVLEHEPREERPAC